MMGDFDSNDCQRYWQQRLGRLRLGVEPLAEQLGRLWRVTWALTIIPGLMGLVMVGLFAAFGETRIGLILVGVLLAPIVALAWLDYGRLADAVADYEREHRDESAAGF